MKLFQKRRLVYSLIFVVSLSLPVPCAAQPRKSDAAVKAYSENEILYWTLRRMIQDKTGATVYSSDLAPGTGGTLIARVPDIHKPGHYERPGFFFPTEDLNQHLTIDDVTPLPLKEFFDELNLRVAQSRNKSVLILIHGYDYSFDEVAYRAGQFLHDSGYDGTMVMFSWPSFGETGDAYPADVEQAMMSITGLADFLGELPNKVPDAIVSVLAHSLGCRIACNALTVLRANNADRVAPILDQLILAAADIDYEAFARTSAKAVRSSSTRVTVYVSKRDMALQFSKGFHGELRRLGGDADGASVALDGINVVDVTDAKSQGGWGMGHMYLFDSLVVMKDIVEVLQGALVDQRSFAIVPLDIDDSVAPSSNP